MPVKVAVLGGGPAGLAAAWALSHDPDTEYEITLYQDDHVLGGKCAAVRAPVPGDPDGHRIEEHGIHILFGFYGQLMQILQEAYAETAGDVGDTGTIQPFAEALIPNDFAFFAEEVPAGTWRAPWRVRFPEKAGNPWDTAELPDVSNLYATLVAKLLEFAGGLAAGTGGSPMLSGLLTALESLFDTIAAVPAIAEFMKDTIIEFAHAILRGAWVAVSPVIDDDTLRRLWIGTYLAGTNLLGLVKDDIFFGKQPFESIDHLDYRAWLAQSDPFAPGEVPSRLSFDSPPVKALYDVVFARSRTFAAGTMARNALTLALGYRGHLSYRMNGSMGEVVMAPIYRALKDEVDFRFFHRVEKIEVAEVDGAKVVDRITFATTIAQGVEYDPLVGVENGAGEIVPSWPAVPNVYEQLPESHRAIVRGTDFDHVILAIPASAFDAADPGNLVADLVAHSPDFKNMVEQTTCSRTQAAQLWIDKELSGIGWGHSLPGGQRPMLISYARPCNSWADMGHLVAHETFGGAAPKTLAYFADELLDDEGATAADVQNNVKKWVADHASRIWTAFGLDDLHDPADGVGEARLSAQYFRANSEGWHRYVLSEAVKINARLGVDESGYANLFLAGDWVRSTLNCGCVEAAVQTGVSAAKAVAAAP